MTKRVEIEVTGNDARAQGASYFELVEAIARGRLSFVVEGFEIYEDSTPLVPPLLGILELYYLRSLLVGEQRIPIEDTERWLNIAVFECILIKSVEGPGYERAIGWMVGAEDAMELWSKIKHLCDGANLTAAENLILYAKPILRTMISFSR